MSKVVLEFWFSRHPKWPFWYPLIGQNEVFQPFWGTSNSSTGPQINFTIEITIIVQKLEYSATSKSEAQPNKGDIKRDRMEQLKRPQQSFMNHDTATTWPRAWSNKHQKRHLPTGHQMSMSRSIPAWDKLVTIQCMQNRSYIVNVGQDTKLCYLWQHYSKFYFGGQWTL